ncbi:hypothetical protein [Hymenobacter sp. B81]|uniref:hypothetical protein n=1 Tax=Hymenobacter sp. B81 TaxID=3344878 RepID=UPI0037DD04AC
MNYYTLLFHAIVRLVRYINPRVSNEGLADGGYWSMNVIIALYLMFILRLLSVYSKLSFILCWLIFFILNYWVFHRKEKWKDIVVQYDSLPADYIDRHTIVLVGALIALWLSLVIVWYQKYVPG